MAAYPHAPRPWLDLSTGVNPEPWPGPRAPAEALRRLPDPEQLAELERLAARVFGVDDPARVVALPGAEAALRLLPDLIGGVEAVLVAPIYGGHAEAWGPRAPRFVGAGMEAGASDVLVLVNPNNPDGRRIKRDTLAALASARSALGRWTVVDESFVEVAPELSVADLAIERLIVLRSFGKFYGLPGARLGFVISNNDLSQQFRALLGDWPLAADAITLGLGAYADDAWRATARARLAAQAAELDALLTRFGLEALGGCDLFRWVAAPNAHALFSRLAKHGVLVRPFAERPDRLRFGLPSRNDFNRLRDIFEAVRP
jgi:cobalamin biosynthetic protein CobC